MKTPASSKMKALVSSRFVRYSVVYGMGARRVRQAGQAMVEYVIVVALVAVAAIAVYQLFGQVIRAQTAAMAREIAGEDGTEQSRVAQSAAELAAAQTAAKSLKSFTGNADAAQ